MKAYLFILLFSLLCGTSHARTLALEWKEVEGATRYEVRLTDEEGSQTLHSAPTTFFEKTLPIGRYQYSIRSWDRLDRPSKWSDAVSVEIEPLPPNPLFPVDEEIQLGPAKRNLELRWEMTEGADAFEIEVERDGDDFASKKVADPLLSVEPSGPGPYQWRVRSVREKAKSGARLKPLRSPWSEWKPFTVLFPELAPPVLHSPRFDSNDTDYTEISLSWDSVPGAAGYEVSWGSQERQVTPATKFKFLLPYGNRAKVQVKALASIQFPDRFVSEPSSIVVDRRLFADWQFRSKFQLAYATGSYAFDNSSAAGNIAASSTGGFSQISLGADTVLNQRWSIHSGLMLHFPFISGASQAVPKARLSVRYRHVFRDRKWSLSYGGGVYGATNLDFVTDRTNSSSSAPVAKRITTFGALLEGSLEWRFHKKWKAESLLAVAVPVFLKDAAAGSSLAPSLSQMRIGATVGYHVAPTWELSAGVALENYAIHYSTAGSAESTSDSNATLRLGLSFVFP